MLCSVILFTFILVKQGYTQANTATCDGLDELIQKRNADILGTCTRDAQCTRVSCPNAAVTVNLGFFSQTIPVPLSITLLPCLTEPGVKLVVISEEVTTSNSGSHGIDNLGTVNWIVDYSAESMSMDLQLGATSALGSNYELFRRTTIPLDVESLCTPPTTTQMPGVQGENPTCNGLDELIQNRNVDILGTCTRDAQCSQVSCPNSQIEVPTTFGDQNFMIPSTITFLPCYLPEPAVIILIDSAFGTLGDFTTYMSEQDRPLDIPEVGGSSASASLSWVLEHSSQTVDGVSIDLQINGTVEGSTFILYSTTTIPLNTSLCPEEVTTTIQETTSPSTTVSTTTGTTVSTPTTATSTPATNVPDVTTPLSTCDGLDELIMNSNSMILGTCSRDVECTQVSCPNSAIQIPTAIGPQNISIPSTITLLPCFLPEPAINIVINSPFAVLGNFTTYTSEQDQPLTITTFGSSSVTATLSWVLEHSSQTADGVSIDLQINGTVDGFTFVLYSQTTIPVDTSLCSDVTTTTEGNTAQSTTTTTNAVSSDTTMTTSSTATVSTTSTTPFQSTSTTPTTAASTTTPTGTTVNTPQATCDGLEELIMNRNAPVLGECAKDAECTQVICPNSAVQVGGGQFRLPSTITLFPCHLPQPAINLLVISPDIGNAVLGNFTTSTSESDQPLQLPVQVITAALSWLVEYSEESMSLDVEINGTVNGETHVLYTRTTIPLDTTMCEEPTLATMPSVETVAVGGNNGTNSATPNNHGTFSLLAVFVLCTVFIVHGCTGS